ncbi:hypothetical protein KFK09_002164 [Dendrobium nobile]|uniref:Uncharacterized protein n=1 Tax=Dendrobium nobile TaxID=94219 RepID=A0A8T3C708_DENNO|nr:hypothetical protein KFK09_002164 [Dendrobium nobile]
MILSEKLNFGYIASRSNKFCVVSFLKYEFEFSPLLPCTKGMNFVPICSYKTIT